MIEVPVTVIGQGRNRHYEWNCIHCGCRMRSGKYGIEHSCLHRVTLEAKRIDLVVALFEDLSQPGQ